MTKADDLLARAYALTGIDGAETKALYRDWAATYDDTMLEGLGYQSPAKVAALLASQNPALDANILDVGCGTGLLAEHLRALGFANIDGLDFSADMLAEAQRLKRINNAYYRDLNQPLPPPDQRYDYLVSTGTFTHGHVKRTLFARTDELVGRWRHVDCDSSSTCMVSRAVRSND